MIVEAEVRWQGEIDSGFMVRKPEVQMQIGVSRSLKRDMTGKKVFFLSSTVCQCATMYRIDGAHLCWAMENLADGHVVNHIVVPDEDKRWAKVALDRMMAVS